MVEAATGLSARAAPIGRPKRKTRLVVTGTGFWYRFFESATSKNAIDLLSLPNGEAKQPVFKYANYQ